MEGVVSLAPRARVNPKCGLLEQGDLQTRGKARESGVRLPARGSELAPVTIATSFEVSKASTARRSPGSACTTYVARRRAIS